MWRHQQIPRDLAIAIKLGNRHYRLVARHLKHAVRAGVDDRKPGRHMLNPEFLDDLRPARRLIPQNPTPNRCLVRRNNIRRKAGRISRKRLRCHDPRHLPVPGHRVLPTLAQLPKPPITSALTRRTRNPARSQKPTRRQMRQPQTRRSLPNVKNRRRVVEVPKLVRVRRLPRPATVHDQHNGPPHRSILQPSQPPNVESS